MSSLFTTKSYLGHDYEMNELIFNMEGDKKVRGGTMAALIEHLTRHEYQGINSSATDIVV
jgi:hypothetical protein